MILSTPSRAAAERFGSNSGYDDYGYRELPSSAGSPNAVNQNIPGTADYGPVVGPYMTRLEKRSKQCWHPPRLERSQSATLLFKVHQNGLVPDVRVSRSSGVQEMDQAALDALACA